MNGVGMIDYGTGGAPVLMARNLAAAKKSWNWNFAKTKRGASGGFLPRPLLLRLRHPNSEKRNQPKFCGILSPENCFRKTSSALFQISSSGLLSKKVRILYNEYRTHYQNPTLAV